MTSDRGRGTLIRQSVNDVLAVLGINDVLAVITYGVVMNGLLENGFAKLMLLLTAIWLSMTGCQESTGSITDDTPVPSYRTRHAMARIGGSKVILFGGTTDDIDVLNDTWQYDTSTHTWEEIVVSGDIPEGRTHHAMAYAGNNRIVLFGGQSVNNNFFDDTWIFDGTDHTWKEYSISGPLHCYLSAMAYAGGSKVVLFGGTGNLGNIDGTYVFDADALTWTNQNIVGVKPSYRWGAVMAYSGAGTIVMFGGISTDVLPNGNAIFIGDTWEYDLQSLTWTEYATAGYSPSKRIGQAMTFAGGNTALLQGGFWGFQHEGHQSNYGDTWMYDAAAHSWTEYTSDLPGVLLIHAMAYTDDGTAVLNGMGQTWEFDITGRTWEEK